MQDFFDLPLAAVFACLPDVGNVQEGGALQADINESRLHSGQDAHDAPEINVADQAPAGRALDVQFLHHALLQHGDAGFLRGEVDEDFFAHGARKR